jgi:hypothetical protein
MKLIILLVFLAISAYACININAITSTINNGLFSFEQVDAENLQGKQLIPFALPHSSCKASFPGNPHAPGFSQQLFMSGLQSGENRVMADREQVYYLSEFSAPAMTIGSLGSSPLGLAASSSTTFDSKKNIWNSQSSTPAGNNSLAGNANFDSEPLKIQNCLDLFLQNWLTDRGAIADRKTPIALKGGLFSGRELIAHSKDNKNHFKLRFYCNYPKKKIVVIGVAGNPTRVSSADSEKFLNSVDMW